MASRGKSAGKSIPAKYADAQRDKEGRVRVGKSLAAAQEMTYSKRVFIGDEAKSMGCFRVSSSFPVGLGDPSFRHVDPMARYYLDYCTFH